VHPALAEDAVTVIVALAFLVGSAWLVATILWLPAAVPAVYTPLVEIVPTLALPPATVSTDQLTAVFVVFSTVAVNGCAWPVTKVAVLGETATETGVGAADNTLTVAELLNTAPVESHAFTVIWCWPANMVTFKFNVAAPTLKIATLSTYSFIAVTVLVSVVPAATGTGDVTVAPFAGEQMVTDGDVVFRVHWAAAPPAKSSNAVACRAAVSSRVLIL
jgi:hypothetical protein